MKKITIALSLFFISIVSTNAQNILDFEQDPLSLFMLEHLHPNLQPLPDSIVSSQDSAAQFAVEDYMLIDYFSNGLIDTATYYDDAGTPVFAYQGVSAGNQTEIIGYDIEFGVTIEDRTSFYRDAISGMDTLIEYYEYDSGNFELFTFFRLSYDAQSRMQAAELHVYDGVSAFFHAGTFDFYYNANNATALDSVKLVSQIGVPIDLLRIHYILRGNGEISRINIKEDTAFTGIYYTTAYEIPKYAAGKIYELQQIIYDDDSGDFETELVTRFLKRNSGIGLDEEKAKENISIYPNPAKDHISINGITQNTDYTIINIIGEKIKSGMITQAELIDVKDLLPGVYIIQIDTGDRIVGKRFEKL